MVGEHIRALKGGRWSHAIDCGDETVIHLAEDSTSFARVRRSYRPEFVAGAESVEVVRHRERTFPAAEVVARAYSRISDPGLAATFRDSEAFAEWCVTGRPPAATANVAVVTDVVAPAPPPAPASAPPPARPATQAKPRRAPARKAKAKPARRPAAAVAKPKTKPTKATPKAKAKGGGSRGKAFGGRASPGGAARKVAKKPARRAARR